MKLLTRREHSRKELLEKLSFRGFDRKASQTVIEHLAEQGWQSDKRFAESYARQRIAKGYGPLRINYEIQQRGGEDIDLNKLIKEQGSSWQQCLQEVYRRKFGEQAQMTYQEWAKRSRFLLQRGFSADMIKQLSEQLEINLHLSSV